MGTPALVIPPAVAYQSPLVSYPLLWFDDRAGEGPLGVSAAIDWGTMGGANNCVSMNPNSNPAAQQTFSRILGLKIDNSKCGADVTFIFPDTSDTITIPAYSPADIFPVFSRSLFFYVNAPNAIAGDVTRFMMLNQLPPPIAIPVTQPQQLAAIQNVAFSNGTTAIVPAGVNGTLQILQGEVYVATAGNPGIVSIQDGEGTPKVLWKSQVPAAPAGAGFVFVSLQQLFLRFQNGINMVVSGTPTGAATVNVNLYYRTP